MLSSRPANAQLNTVTLPDSRYKVETLSQDTSSGSVHETVGSGGVEKEKSAPGSIPLSGTDMKKKEQTARYMSVCYPLSSIRVNSPYGYRKDPFSGRRRFHNGLDLHARSAKVYAMMAGEVVKVRQDKVSDKYVTLRHGSFTVSYCHLSRILAYEGQTVKAGDIVGITGNTGRSTGEHLHITVRQKGEYLNPQIFLDYILSVMESCVMALVSI